MVLRRVSLGWYAMMKIKLGQTIRILNLYTVKSV
jgi:hypothetical protein